MGRQERDANVAITVEPAQQQGGAVSHLLQPPCRHLDARAAGEIERHRFPLHDGIGVIDLRELGNGKLALLVEHGRLGARTAQR